MMEFFENVEQAPSDPIFGLSLVFAADERKSKINLVIGAYRTSDLKPYTLPCVKKAEKKLIEFESNKDYLPIDGDREYVRLTKELVFGGHSEAIYGTQAVGGTGALRVGGMFLKELGFSTIYISDPGWDNHRRIFQHVGLEVKTYPYFDWKRRGFNFEGVCQTLEQLPPRTIVLLQPCCHNPTGADPTKEEWQQLLELMRAKELFPFFDLAYQGFGEGLEEDPYPVRLFVDAGMECIVAVSHAKNFGLYAERAGVLFFVCHTVERAKHLGSRVKVIIRGLYSNPPCHGARIVSTILQDPQLKKEWVEELTAMRERIVEMRSSLIAQLHAMSTKTSFDFLTKQRGMFSYTGLGKVQVDRLISEYGIYMTRDGRINVAGLNTENIGYIAKAILSVSDA